MLGVLIPKISQHTGHYIWSYIFKTLNKTNITSRTFKVLETYRPFIINADSKNFFLFIIYFLFVYLFSFC